MDRDKFLTEQMGECWHQAREGSVWHCDTCGCQHLDPVNRANPNFSDWCTFGKLWEWAIKQEWWDTFLTGTNWDFIVNLINPDNFANALYEFLKHG